MIYYLMNFAGWGTYSYAFIINLGDVKAFILFLIGCTYICLKMYITWDKNRDEKRMRELKIKEREFEVHEKIGDEEEYDDSKIND